MAKTKLKQDSAVLQRPALTPEQRELQMIAKAVALAEQQLDDGTASSQIITHYLKLGSSRERLERERLEEENKLLRAKTEAIQSGKSIESLYAEAISAMQEYKGNTSDSDDYES